jgi:hypothetical protein
MKTFLMIMVIVWFVLGASVAHGRGYFDTGAPRTCTFVGSGLLTLVAGPINYAGLHPRAAC